MTLRVGGKAWTSFLALPSSLTIKVYKFLVPLTLNLVWLTFLPLDLTMVCDLMVAVLTSDLLANSTNCLMSVISLCRKKMEKGVKNIVSNLFSIILRKIQEKKGRNPRPVLQGPLWTLFNLCQVVPLQPYCHLS